MGVRSIGSKSVDVLPDKWTRVGAPEKSPSTSLFLAGKIENFINFEHRLSDLTEESYCTPDLMKVWGIEHVSAASKLKESQSAIENYFEVGIQLIPDGSSEFIKQSFVAYAISLGFEVKEELSFDISNLWFMPFRGDPKKIIDLAKHSFVRVIRPLVPLRTFRPLVRGLPGSSKAKLPTLPPVAADVNVAILDGGLPESHALGNWVSNYHKSDSLAFDCKGGPEHGLGVTSAFLFGPLPHNNVAARPYSFVDHHRILDSKITSEDPLELYRTLTHIEDILISRQYEFINISLGPDLPIDDDEIHPWTSLLDTYLADGETFLTIASGNNGDADEIAGLNRIQVPSDCVNAIAVGASDKTTEKWERALYSAVGPGRAPGRVKPDLLAFGGSSEQYFHVVDSGVTPNLIPSCGTSFSAPYLLRKAVGVKAVIGDGITPLAIKALLINSAQRNHQDLREIGWGKVVDEVSDLIQSPEGVAKILYQGELQPGKYLRVPVPVPADGINGKVNIKATCCFSAHVDPQDTSMYTKAGVEISWIPKKDGPKESFFQQVKKATEAELRRDAAKWETTLHAEKRKIGNKLDHPAFEIHYMARNSGAEIGSSKADIIKYAFIVTLEAPKHGDIFVDIMNAYSEILSEIEPRIATDIGITV
jgi:hypothetical protein